jgi:hypothetical protein
MSKVALFLIVAAMFTFACDGGGATTQNPTPAPAAAAPTAGEKEPEFVAADENTNDEPGVAGEDDEVEEVEEPAAIDSPDELGDEAAEDDEAMDDDEEPTEDL